MLRFVFKLIHDLFFKRKHAKGVLVIQPLPGIGDVIWYLPHVHSIADSCGPVTLLTKPRSFADVILKTDASVEQVFWLERNPGKHSGIRGFFRLVGELRQKNYAQAWILHGSSRYAWMTYLAGIPDTVGYGHKFQKYLLSRSDCLLDKKELAVHGIQRATRLLEYANIPRREKNPQLRFDDYATNAQQCAERYLLVNPPRKKFALAVGSSVACKQWGSQNFCQLADYLILKYGAQILLIAGPAEQELIQEIIASATSSADNFLVLAGIPLEEVALLLSLCDACIGNDTGVLNIAAATSTHSFGLFGSTTPLSYSSWLHPIVPAGDGPAPSSLQQEFVNRMNEISIEQVCEKIKQEVIL